MYCPQCGAEYRPSATVCSDCQVALVPDPPSRPEKNALSRDEYFALVWSGIDSRKQAEIIESLEHEDVPVRTLHRGDTLFPIGHAALEIYTPSSLAEKAKAIVNQTDPSYEDSEKAEEPGTFEIAADDDIHENAKASRELKDWHSEDATLEIWAGQDADLARMIMMSLRENQIPCRSSKDEGESDSTTQSTERLYVLPEDEARAKEIVREIVDAVPPQ
jgi:hypothetical protein